MLILLFGKIFINMFFIRFLIVFIVFISFTVNAQEDDFLSQELKTVIENNDVESYTKVVEKFKELIAKEDELRTEEDGMFLLSFYASVAFVIKKDRVDLSKVIINLIDPSNLVLYQIDKKFFLDQSLYDGSYNTVAYFLSEGVTVNEESIFDLMFCANIAPEESTVVKKEEDYLKILHLLKEKAVQLPANNLVLDDFFLGSECKSIEFIQGLIDLGADGEEESWEKFRAMQTQEFKLIAAIKNNDYTSFTQLLASDDLDITFEYDNLSPLEYAISYNRNLMLTDLIEEGWDINAINTGRVPRFHIISLSNSIELITTVLSNTSNINKLDKYNQTILHKLIKEYGSRLEEETDELTKKQELYQIFELLITFGADANIESNTRGYQKIPLELLANTDIKDEVDKKLFILLLKNTTGDTAFSSNLIRTGYDFLDREIIDMMIPKAKDISPFLDTGMSYDATGNNLKTLQYITHNYKEKITPEHLRSLTEFYVKIKPNPTELHFTLDSIVPNTNVKKDSIITDIVNRYGKEDFRYNKKTLLFELLEKYVDSEDSNEEVLNITEDLIIVLINNKASLLEGSINDVLKERNSSVNYMLQNIDMFNKLPRHLHSYLIGKIDVLEFNKKNTPIRDATGKLHKRANIYLFEKKYAEDLTQDFCVTGKMVGPSNTGIDMSNVREAVNFHCKDDVCTREQISAPNISFAATTLCNNESRGQGVIPRTGWPVSVRKLETNNEVNNQVSRKTLYASTSLESFSMQASFNLRIPKVIATDSIIDGLPMFSIKNTAASNMKIAVEQDSTVVNLFSKEKMTFNRTLGDIFVKFSGAASKLNLELEFDYNLTSIDIHKVQNITGSSLKSRLELYAYLYELKNTTKKTYSDIIMERILAEYTLQKDFKKTVKDELEEAYKKVVDYEEEVLKLYKFQKEISRNNTVSQTNLFKVLRKIKRNSNDPDVIRDIDTTIAALIDSNDVISNNLAIFTSSYFKKIYRDVYLFEQLLIEFSLYKTNENETNEMLNNPQIRLVL